MSLFAVVKSLPVLAACVLAVDYPPIPKDLTTPYQQRLAIYGPNGERKICQAYMVILPSLD